MRGYLDPAFETVGVDDRANFDSVVRPAFS
jgi:hypothetical protein